jgi:hypothetical protein
VTRRRPHAALLALLAVTVLYGSIALWRRASRPGGRWVGYMECSWVGKPRIVVRDSLGPVETVAVTAHESVHAAQCDSLGPLRYRWRTLFAESNLALETPAYCEGARVRTRLTRDTVFDRLTMHGNMVAAMGDALDSATIARAIVSTCREFAPRP